MKAKLRVFFVLISAAVFSQELTPCLDCGMPELNFNRLDPGANVFFKGEYLYWKAYADTLDWAGTYVLYDDQTIQIPYVRNDLEIHNATFSWDSAFRISTGFSICSWDNTFSWTYFHTSGKDSFNYNNLDNWGLITSARLSIPANIWPIGIQASLDYFESMAAKYHIQLNNFDWELGKSLYLGRTIFYRPFFGVRGARLTQRMTIKAQNLVPLSAEIGNSKMGMKNVFIGIGPRLGIDGTWNVNDYFAMYGQSAFALLGGKFGLYENDVFNFGNDPSVFVYSGNQFTLYTFKPCFDVGFGFQFFYEFCMGLRTELDVGYEFHLWPSQTQLYRLYDQARAVKQVGDVAMHGLNISGSIYF